LAGNTAATGGVFTAGASAYLLSSGSKAGSTAPYLFTTTNKIISTTNSELALKWSKHLKPMQNTGNLVRSTFGGLAKGAGTALGIGGVGLTLYQYRTDRIGGTETTGDLIMGGVGFIGPPGAAVSASYFLMLKGSKPPETFRNPLIMPNDATRFQMTPRLNLKK